MLNIKVLGIGGTRYFNLIKNLKEAVKQLDFDVQIEFLKEVEDFIRYELLEIPALVVNGDVIKKGQFLEIDEIALRLKELYQNQLQEQRQPII
jgi:hypothetical protein